MKRSMSLVLIACGVFAYAAPAAANDEPRNNKEFQYKHGKNPRNLEDLISKLKKHHDDDDDKHPIPIDPGKGDGKPTPPPAPQGPPGFVWVKDHWERTRATSGSTTTGTPTGTIVVRDHRNPYSGTDISQASGGVVVTSGGPIIRDHRTTTTDSSQASGGVVVTSGGPIIRDHRTIKGKPIYGSGTYGGLPITQPGNGSPRPRGNGGGGGGILDSIGDAASGIADGIGDVVGGAASTVGHGAVRVVDTVGDAVGVGGKSSSTPRGRVTVIRDHRK